MKEKNVLNSISKKKMIQIGQGWIQNPFVPLKDQLNVNIKEKLLHMADEGLKVI